MGVGVGPGGAAEGCVEADRRSPSQMMATESGADMSFVHASQEAFYFQGKHFLLTSSSFWKENKVAVFKSSNPDFKRRNLRVYNPHLVVLWVFADLVHVFLIPRPG